MTLENQKEQASAWFEDLRTAICDSYEKLETDYAISTTGYAGPTGGTVDDPVGTVFIGLHTPSGVWVKRHFFRGNRETIKLRASNAAIDWLRRELTKNQDSETANAELRSESAKIIRSLK